MLSAFNFYVRALFVGAVTVTNTHELIPEIRELQYRSLNLEDYLH